MGWLMSHATRTTIRATTAVQCKMKSQLKSRPWSGAINKASGVSATPWRRQRRSDAARSCSKSIRNAVVIGARESASQHVTRKWIITEEMFLFLVARCRPFQPNCLRHVTQS